MTLGEKIKELRAEKNMTQKSLADQLNVTAQAVSRWESNDVEPSINTLKQMATIFEVSVDELLSQDTEPKIVEVEKEKIVEKVVEKPVIVEKQVVVEKTVTPKPVLGVCESCKKAITNPDDFIQTHHRKRGGGYTTTLCKDCRDKQIANARQERISSNNKHLIWHFIAGIAAFLLAFGFFSIFGANSGDASWFGFGAIVGALLYFMIGCFVLCNNPVYDIWSSIAEWSIKFPGVIFTLDLDGIIFLIAVKLLFAILGAILSVIVFLLATAIASICAVFVYPFALYNIIKHRDE